MLGQLLKKHFNKLIQKFNTNEDALKEAFELIEKMDQDRSS